MIMLILIAFLGGFLTALMIIDCRKKSNGSIEVTEEDGDVTLSRMVLDIDVDELFTRKELILELKHVPIIGAPPANK